MNLEFTRENYSTEQKIRVNAPIDVNSVNESATVTFSAEGLPDVSKTITVSDDLTIVVTGTPSSLQEGTSAPVGVKLSKKPSETKTVLISSSSASLVIDGSANKSLTFTQSDYNIPQTVQLQTVIDADSVSESVNVIFSTEGIPDVSYGLTVIDDLTIQVSGVPSTLTEQTSANIAVRFSRTLIADSAVTVSSDNPSIQINGGSSALLNFTPANSTADQPLTISAVDDANLTNELVHLTFSAPGVSSVTAALTAVDNDTMNILTSGVPLTISEGSSGTMQVALTQDPGSDYTVNITTNNLSSLSPSPASLTFNSGNYNVPQTVTLTAPEDANENSEDVTVILTASNAPLQTQTVTVIDNDTRILIGGADSVLEGGEAIVTVSLSGSPGISRTVSLSSSNTLGGTITPATLTFSPSSFSSSIAITGVQDANAVNEATSVSGSGTGLLSGSKNISIIDDDTVNFDIAGGTQILEGGSLSLQVRLTYAPASNLTVNVSSADTGSVTAASSTLTFTPANYNVYQTLVLNGVEDINETSENVNISFSASGVPSRNYTVTTLDNDTRPVFGGNFTVPEESFSVATVVLSANPGTSRTVTLSSLNTNAVTVSPSSLIFNENNWNSPQSIILAGVADSNTVSEAVTIRAVTGTVTVDQMSNTQDNDTLAMILTDGNGNSIPNGTVLNINEGSSMTFKIKFNYEPSSPVTVNFSNPLTPLNVQLLTFSPASLTFNSANYSIEQTVTVTAVENDYIDDKSTSISFNPAGGFTGSRIISALVKDNDPIVHVRVPGNLQGHGWEPHIFYDPVSQYGPLQIFSRRELGDPTSWNTMVQTPCDTNFSCTFPIGINYTSGPNTSFTLRMLQNKYSNLPRYFGITRNYDDLNDIYIFYSDQEAVLTNHWSKINLSATLGLSGYSGWNVRAAIDNVNGRIYTIATGDAVLATCRINIPPDDCKSYNLHTLYPMTGYATYPNLVVDNTVNGVTRLLITFGDTGDEDRLKGYVCTIDGVTGVLDTCIIRNIFPLTGTPNREGYSSFPMIDTVSNKVIIGHTNHVSFLTICNLDFTGCSTTPLNAAQGGGNKSELLIDPVFQKLYIFIYDYNDSFTLVSFRCNLDGSGCKRRNIGKLFGSNTNGAEPSATYNPVNKRIYVATRNEELGNVVSVYHFISYIEDP